MGVFFEECDEGFLDVVEGFHGVMYRINVWLLAFYMLPIYFSP